MQTLKKTLLLPTLLIVPIGSAVAQADNPPAPAAQGAASAASGAAKFDLPVNITVGDRIKLRSNITGLTPVDGATGSRAPAGTCFRVTRLNDNSGITVAVEQGTGLRSGTCKTPEGTNPVVVGDVYKISGEQLKNASYARYGWIYGPMLVPFKYFPHDRSFEPSQSLGMYMGFRTSWFESRGLSWVASTGLATMKVSQVVDDPANPGSKTTKENTIAGYTMAGGVLFDLTSEAKPFVAGLMIGRDFVGRNSAITYTHDNRNWIALQVGWVQ